MSGPVSFPRRDSVEKIGRRRSSRDLSPSVDFDRRYMTTKARATEPALMWPISKKSFSSPFTPVQEGSGGPDSESAWIGFSRRPRARDRTLQKMLAKQGFSLGIHLGDFVKTNFVIFKSFLSLATVLLFTQLSLGGTTRDTSVARVLSSNQDIVGTWKAELQTPNDDSLVIWPDGTLKKEETRNTDRGVCRIRTIGDMRAIRTPNDKDKRDLIATGGKLVPQKIMIYGIKRYELIPIGPTVRQDVLCSYLAEELNDKAEHTLAPFGTFGFVPQSSDSISEYFFGTSLLKQKP